LQVGRLFHLNHEHVLTQVSNDIVKLVADGNLAVVIGRLMTNAEGEPQWAVYRDGYPWHYATQEKLAEEIGLSARQVGRSIQRLKQLTLIEVKLMKPRRQDSLGNLLYGPTPINHYRICWEHLDGLLAALREKRHEQRLAATRDENS
jgi:hypothetical protein